MASPSMSTALRETVSDSPAVTVIVVRLVTNWAGVLGPVLLSPPQLTDIIASSATLSTTANRVQHVVECVLISAALR
jgi:hypothetical protein